MARLPNPGSDAGEWGEILNDFLEQVHQPDGTLKDNTVSSSTLTTGAVNASAIEDGSVTKPKLSSAVQDSLDKADTALQSAPVTSVNSQTGAVELDKADIGLGNADNTADLSKPISTATQTALDGKASAAQGTLADTAVQPGDLATVATTGDYDDLTGNPTTPVSVDATKSSNTNYSNTTLADDPDLQVTLPVGSFDFEALVLYQASPNNDAKLQLAFTGTATVAASAGFYATNVSSIITTAGTSSSGSKTIGTIFALNAGTLIPGGGGSGTTLHIRYTGRVTVTAGGTFKIKGARNADTDVAENTVFLAGSYLTAVEVVTTA